MRFTDLGRSLYGGMFRDYVESFRNVSSFFEYDPADDSSFRARAEQIRSHFQGDRASVSKALVETGEEAGLSREAVDNARLLARGDALAVVAGQQIGLCTGPLLTAYKAVSAIRLARSLQATLGSPVVPVFWMATDDHDLSEVDRASLPSPRGGVLTVVVPLGNSRGVPAGRIRLPDGAERPIDDLLAGLDGPHRGEVIDKVWEAFRSSGTLSQLFARLMGWLFSAHGLVLLDPAHPAMRRAAVEPVTKWVQSVRSVDRALESALEERRNRGYSDGFELDPNDLYLFRMVRGKRVGLRSVPEEDGRGPDQFTTRWGDLRWEREGLLGEIRSMPDDFSPGFLLRPIVQEYLLPTVATVSGPGEISYLSLLRGVYRLFGLKMPVIVPRLSMSVVSRDVERAMSSYQVDFEKVTTGFECELERVLVGTGGMDIGAEFERIYERFERSIDEIRLSFKGFDKGFEKALSRGWERIRAAVRQIEREARRSRRRAMPDVVREMERIRDELWPNGRPQETVINTLYYVSKAGPGLIDRLVETGDLRWGFHHLCFLEED